MSEPVFTATLKGGDGRIVGTVERGRLVIRIMFDDRDDEAFHVLTSEWVDALFRGLGN